jgi:hypothetical protein
VNLARETTSSARSSTLLAPIDRPPSLEDLSRLLVPLALQPLQATPKGPSRQCDQDQTDQENLGESDGDVVNESVQLAKPLATPSGTSRKGQICASARMSRLVGILTGRSAIDRRLMNDLKWEPFACERGERLDEGRELLRETWRASGTSKGGFPSLSNCDPRAMRLFEATVNSPVGLPTDRHEKERQCRKGRRA